MTQAHKVCHFLPTRKPGRPSLDPITRRFHNYLYWIRANERDSERRAYARLSEEEQFTWRLRHTPGWPGPDPQPRGMFEILRNWPHPEVFPRSAMRATK